MKMDGSFGRKLLAGAAFLAATLSGQEGQAQQKDTAAAATAPAEKKEFPKRAVMTNPAELKKALDAGFQPESEPPQNETNEDKAQRLSKAYSEVYAIFDKQANWMDKNIHSPEYKRRLIEEEGQTEASYEQRKNLQQASKGTYVVENNVTDSKGVPTNAAGYTGVHGDVHLSLWRKRSSDLVHEMQHITTDGERLMSPTAVNLYGKSFTTKSIASERQAKYLAEPSERDARKKQVEYDMERLNIKKYDEKFTPEHYKKLLEWKAKGVLSGGSEQFIETTDPAYFEQIFNTIAYQDTDPATKNPAA